MLTDEVVPKPKINIPKLNLKSLTPEFNPQISKPHLIPSFVQKQFFLLIIWIVLNSNVYKKSPDFTLQFQKV